MVRQFLKSKFGTDEALSLTNSKAAIMNFKDAV